MLLLIVLTALVWVLRLLMVPPVVSRSVPVPLIRLLEEVLAKVMLWMLRSLLSVMVWPTNAEKTAREVSLIDPAFVLPGMPVGFQLAVLVQLKEAFDALVFVVPAAWVAGERRPKRRAVKSEKVQSERCKGRRPRKVRGVFATRCTKFKRAETGRRSPLESGDVGRKNWREGLIMMGVKFRTMALFFL